MTQAVNVKDRTSECEGEKADLCHWRLSTTDERLHPLVGASDGARPAVLHIQKELSAQTKQAHARDGRFSLKRNRSQLCALACTLQIVKLMIQDLESLP